MGYLYGCTALGGSWTDAGGVFAAAAQALRRSGAPNGEWCVLEFAPADGDGGRHASALAACGVRAMPAPFAPQAASEDGAPSLRHLGESHALLAQASMVWLDSSLLTLPGGTELLRRLKAAADASGVPCAVPIGAAALRADCRGALLALCEGAGAVIGAEAQAKALLGCPDDAVGPSLAESAAHGALLVEGAERAVLHRTGRPPLEARTDAGTDRREEATSLAEDQAVQAWAGGFLAALLTGGSARRGLEAGAEMAARAVLGIDQPSYPPDGGSGHPTPSLTSRRSAASAH